MSGDSSVVSVSAEPRRVDDARGTDFRDVLDALGDSDCRDILRAMGGAALTASECSEACDLPLSTTYRKLERLSGAGLIEEGLRIRRDGKHASQYQRRFSDVVVELGTDGSFGVEVHQLPRADEGVPSSLEAD
ncbi:MAG TPA: helix-turn-helix domain-containing protein [Halobacteriales archaeon]|nr:helix-turn-helix domain-containing protein [Halobacteriales archaeon]